MTARIVRQRRLARRRLVRWVRRWRDWTGLGGYTERAGHHRGKTLWDWADLLIVPAMLAGLAVFFANQNTAATERAASERAKADRNLAADQARETALQAYLDKMDDLVLDGKLLASPEDAEVRQVARTRTLATLRQLDGRRNGLVVRHLSESGLITATVKGNPIADLHSADLRDADLTGAYLTHAILGGADLRDADLTGADLHGADLTGADLTGADLRGAWLTGADLTDAVLRGADLTDAVLGAPYQSAAYQSAAYMGGADLRDADLTDADLRGAHLTDVDLTGADLTGADLTGAVLYGADLRGAHLGGADLRGAHLGIAFPQHMSYVGLDLSDVKNLTPTQLNATLSYYGAQPLPTGLHPDTRPTPTVEP